MNDLFVHLGLLALISLAIVTLGAFFGNPEDSDALKQLPRRFGVFLLGCAAVVVIMMLIERTGASLG